MTATPATPASPFMARVTIGAAAPAAEELVPLPPALFVALAKTEDALPATDDAIDAATDEAEAALDEAADFAEATALDTDADAPDALEEADLPAPVPELETEV